MTDTKCPKCGMVGPECGPGARNGGYGCVTRQLSQATEQIDATNRVVGNLLAENDTLKAKIDHLLWVIDLKDQALLEALHEGNQS